MTEGQPRGGVSGRDNKPGLNNGLTTRMNRDLGIKM